MTSGPAIDGPVFVAGPPGAGKTTLSRAAAARLHLEIIDTDEEVQSRVGIDVPTLIEEQGEAALRAEERRVVASVGTEPKLVALGGGAWIDDATRRTIRGRGLVVGLHADRDVLWSRISGDTTARPLYPTRADFDRVMDDRDPIYRRSDVAVRTDAASPEHALTRAILDAGFASVPFGSRRTRVIVGRELELATGAAVAELSPRRPVLVVEDAGAPKALRDRHVAAIDGARVVRYELPGGDRVKAWDSLGALLSMALAEGCGRQSVVVGIGGGAVCDLAALAASLLGRGAPLVLVPTTLLAQVDASIGGKAAVNMGGGKNQIGAFAPARDVISDLDFLQSLNASQIAEGQAESYKAALLSSAEHRRSLVESREPTVKSVVRAIRTKSQIVEADPEERDQRRLLNLGHTWGHAVESASNFSMAHGLAVAIGIAFIARWSADRGLIDTNLKDEILDDLDRLGLPCQTPPHLFDAALSHLRADKKGDSERVALVALRGDGAAEIIDYSWEQLERDLLRLEKTQ